MFVRTERERARIGRNILGSEGHTTSDEVMVEALGLGAGWEGAAASARAAEKGA